MSISLSAIGRLGKYRSKQMKRILFSIIAAWLILPTFTYDGQYEEFRFPREQSTTKDGYPTPLSGKPITIEQLT